jgi:hypothetical protein
MTTDTVLALESLGYTRREASFLYLVAVHSGYFVRRQFDYFIDRVSGQAAQCFLEKARIAGHIEVLDYGQRHHVYHLFFKPIYRLLGDPDSQNRRHKGDSAIRARLLSLDYVLAHEDDRYLESAADRVRYFAEARRVPEEFFAASAGQLQPTLACFPVALAGREHPDRSPVKFVFPDEASITVEKFIRFLGLAEPLLRALGSFEVVYVSNSAQNFPAALAAFKKTFDRRASNLQSALAPEWRGRLGDACPKDKRVPRMGRDNPPLHAKFRTQLMNFSYPKLRRSENGSPDTAQLSTLPERSQVLRSQSKTKSAGSTTGQTGGGSDPGRLPFR